MSRASMSTSNIAAAAVASQQSQLQLAMQTAMLKAGHSQDIALVEMIAESAETAAKLTASAPPGTGTRLDIRV